MFDGFWVANIILKERKSDMFRSEAKEEVQEQMLHFLGQQALEVEKVPILLRKAFESLSEK